MTYPEIDDDNETDDEQQPSESRVSLSREQIRSLERDAKQARKMQEENAQIRRELAFAQSGHQFTERQQKALLSVVDGDLTADAIKEAAAELGFITVSEPASTDDLAALERIGGASAGSDSTFASEDDISRLYQADREGGRDAVIAELRRKGVYVDG